MVVLEDVAVVVLGQGVDDEGRKDLVLALLVHAVKVDERVLLVEGELLIFGQVVEHLTVVADVVSVDNQIGAGGLDVALVVDVRGAVVVVLLIEAQAVVVVVVRGLHNREVDVGVLDLQPSLDVLILQIERIELGQVVVGVALDVGDVDLALGHILLRLLHLALQGGQILLRLFVLRAEVDQVEHRTAEDQNADPQQNLAHLLKADVVLVGEQPVQNALKALGRFGSRRVLLLLLFFAPALLAGDGGGGRRCQGRALRHDLHALQHCFLCIAAVLRRLRIAVRQLSGHVEQPRHRVGGHLGQRPVVARVQLLHQTAAV